MSTKKVKAPNLQQWKGNAYTDYLEGDLGGYHDWVQNNWQDALTAPNLSDYYDYAKQVNAPAMNDFLQDYNTQANAIASRNYNRFGGLTNTPASYTQDMYNKQMNDLAVRKSAQELSDAYQMSNQDWANRLNAFNAGYNLFTNTGDYLTQTKDIPNWNIQNMNEVNRVNAYNANHQGNGILGNVLSTVGGAAAGFLTGGPAGAIAGGIGGLASSLSGGNSGQSFAYGNLGNLAQQQGSGLNWLNNKLGYTVR